MSDGIYSGKVVFVTGGANGIGRATALAFAREGASVVVTDVVEEKAQAVATAIGEQGGTAIAVRCDVTHSEDIRSGLDRTVEAFGGLDIAFNNAGIELTNAKIVDVDRDRIVTTDLGGVCRSMKYQIPLMLKRGDGAIVNVSPGAGIRAVPDEAVYTAAKFGVVGLTQAAAPEYVTSNIRANAICPGNIDTPMMGRVAGSTEGYAKIVGQEPVGRMGRPDKIAAAALYPCSDAAAFTVGLAMIVDGGQSVGLS